MSFLDELTVFFEEGAKEQTEVLDEILFVVLPVCVGHSDVSVQRQHLKKIKHMRDYFGSLKKGFADKSLLSRCV